MKWLVSWSTPTDRSCWRKRGLLGPLQRLGLVLRPLSDTAQEVVPLGVVLAPTQKFDSEHNHGHVRERLGAVSVIPAKRGKATWRVQGHRAEMRAAFPSESAVSTTGAGGGERVFGAQAQAVGTSTRPEPRNAADTGAGCWA